MITFKADENCEFNYVYYDDNTVNTFNVNLIHILSHNKRDNSFEIEKDYYLDVLNNTSNNYAYNLNGSHLEFSKSFNKNFVITDKDVYKRQPLVVILVIFSKGTLNNSS